MASAVPLATVASVAPGYRPADSRPPPLPEGRARQALVLGRDPQAEPMRLPERRRDGIQIIQLIHIHQGGGKRPPSVSARPKPRGPLSATAAPPTGQLFRATIIHAVTHPDGCAPPAIRPAISQPAHSRTDRNPRHPVDARGIFAVAAGAGDRHAAGRQTSRRSWSISRPLGRNAKPKGHAGSPARPSRSATSPGRTIPPTAGIDRPAPSTAVSAS